MSSIRGRLENKSGNSDHDLDHDQGGSSGAVPPLLTGCRSSALHHLPRHQTYQPITVNGGDSERCRDEAMQNNLLMPSSRIYGNSESPA